MPLHIRQTFSFAVSFLKTHFVYDTWFVVAFFLNFTTVFVICFLLFLFSFISYGCLFVSLFCLSTAQHFHQAIILMKLDLDNVKSCVFQNVEEFIARKTKSVPSPWLRLQIC